jgi:hypothetical protein
MIKRWAGGKGIFGAAVLVSVLVVDTAAAAAPVPCDVRLTVELTPDIPSGLFGSEECQTL